MRGTSCSRVLYSLAIFSLLLRRGSMNPSDCWNEDKLNTMSADGDEHDKNLSKFNMMVKCLMQERSPGGGAGGIDWNQFNNIAQSGRFPKKKPPPQNTPPNYPEEHRRNRGDYYERPPPNKQDWIRPGSSRNNPPPSNNNNNRGGAVSSQPRPGVHPEDWNEDIHRNNNNHHQQQREDDDSRRDSRYNSDNTPLWGQPSGGSDRGYNKKERKRNNNRRNKQDSKRMDPLESPPVVVQAPPPNSPPGGVVEDPSWGGGEQRRRPFEEENPFISATDFGGDANLSLHRKYGYAVMAMSVVVLAVLMVSTIFCCNSSNSTMSQPAVAGIAQLDNYSLYSYKQGMGLPPATTDTLRSGTIRSSMRTDTLRSSATTGQFRSSPQYRVSDIDPDFARRYKDENHY